MKLPWGQKSDPKEKNSASSETAGQLATPLTVEESERFVIAEVIEAAEAHVDSVLQVRRDHPVDAADLLSETSAAPGKNLIGSFLKQPGQIADELKRQTENLHNRLRPDELKKQPLDLFKPGTNVVEQLRKQTTSLHSRMRSLIEDVARLIENGEYIAVEERIGKAGLAARERDSALRLITAHKQSNVSIKALQITVSVFKEFNQRIIDRLNNRSEQDRYSEKDLILANAILVYEISNFLIRYIEGFQIWGLDEIRKLQNEINKKFDEQERVEKQLKADAEKQPDEMTKARTIEQIENREKQAKRVRQEWDAFVAEIEGLQGIRTRLDARLATLRVVRDNAKNQITFVDLLTMTATVKDALACLDAAFIDVEGLELVPITEDRVERLLSLTM